MRIRLEGQQKERRAGSDGGDESDDHGDRDAEDGCLCGQAAVASVAEEGASFSLLV